MSDDLAAGVSVEAATEQVTDIHERIATTVDGATTHSRTGVWCVWTVEEPAFEQVVSVVCEADRVHLTHASREDNRVGAEHVAYGGDSL